MKDWNSAQSTCKEDGGNLAIIFNQKTRDVVKGLEKWSLEYWIGVTDQWNEGTWQTATKLNLPYTNWAPGEPNNADYGEDCAYQNWDTKWNDEPCSKKKAFICQFKGITYYSCECLGIR